MAVQKVNILGEEWTLDVCPKEKYEKLGDDCDGFCDDSVRLMVVCDYSSKKPSPDWKSDLSREWKKTIRHEMVHSFMYESGLTGSGSAWAQNEEMVDWVAYQLPKMVEAMKSVGAL